MHHIIKFVSIMVFFTNSFISCSYLQKMKDRFQNRPTIEGEGAEDIVNMDIDFDKRGSDSGSIKGLNSIYFRLNSSELTGSVKRTLRANKAWLDNNSGVKKMILEGHCDSLGSEVYNIGLGKRRARSVLDYLISIGISKSKTSIISYGEENPISRKNNINRRVNFVPQY